MLKENKEAISNSNINSSVPISRKKVKEALQLVVQLQQTQEIMKNVNHPNHLVLVTKEGDVGIPNRTNSILQVAAMFRTPDRGIQEDVSREATSKMSSSNKSNQSSQRWGPSWLPRLARWHSSKEQALNLHKNISNHMGIVVVRSSLQAEGVELNLRYIISQHIIK